MNVTRYRIATVAIIGVIIIGCIVGILVPAGLGWDFANFYDAGHRVAAGQVGDLYNQHSMIEGRPPQGEMRFWSAPLAAVLLAPLSWFPPDVALPLFKIQNTLALFLALALWYWHCRRFIAREHQWAFAATFAFACLLYQPFWTIFRVGGQTTPTVFLLFVMALLAYTESRFVATSILLVTAVMLKPTFAIMLVFLVAVGGTAFARAFIATSAFVGLLAVALMGWPIHRQFASIVLEGSQFSRGWVYNSSLYVPIENFRLLALAGSASARGYAAAEWILRVAVVALFVVIFRRSERWTWPVEARRHFEFLMAICFWLLTSPLIWEHYLAALFVPLGYFLARWETFSTSARRLLKTIFVLAVGQNLVLVQFIATRVQPETVWTLIVAGLLKAGPLVLLLVLLLSFHGEVLSTYRSGEWRATPNR